jgi:hypothetical protein
MRHISGRLLFVVACALVAAHPATFAASVSSTFDTDLDGWTANNTAAVHTPAGGNPGGFLFIDNPESTISEVLAPAKFLGDKSSFNGGTLSFDGNLLTQDAGDFAAYGTLTFFSSSIGTASTDIVPSQPPVGQWVTYTADLTNTTFGITPGDWAAILADLDELRITLEGVFGGETNGFDNFKIDDGQVIPPPVIPLPMTWALALPWLVGTAGWQAYRNRRGRRQV